MRLKTISTLYCFYVYVYTVVSDEHLWILLVLTYKLKKLDTTVITFYTAVLLTCYIYRLTKHKLTVLSNETSPNKQAEKHNEDKDIFFDSSQNPEWLKCFAVKILIAQDSNAG